MTSFWTPWRQRWYPVGFIVAVVAGLIAIAITADGPSTLGGGRLGGDFPAFYSAGTILADGDVDQLYDLRRQFEAQADLFPGDEPEALYFAYPPHVAAAYRLLVPFGYNLGYVIWTGISIAALLGAIVLAEPLIPALRRRRAIAMAAALAFLPMAEGVLLGQNTAISLLILVASWRLVVMGNHWGAGAVLGVLVYRPQLAIPLAGLYLLTGRWRVTLGAAATSVVAYLVSAAMMGATWVTEWIEQARAFNELDVDLNGHLSVSAVGFFANLGVEAIGWAIAVAVAATMSWLWWRRNGDLGLLMAVAAAGLVLMSPHAQSYEPGLMLITLAVFIDRGVPHVRWFWIGGLGKFAGDWIGFNFTFVAVAVAFVMALQITRRPAEVAV